MALFHGDKSAAARKPNDCCPPSDCARPLDVMSQRRSCAVRELRHSLAIDASLCQSETYALDVETTGELTAGQVVVDRRPLIRDEEREGYPIDCAMGVDVERFMQLFTHRVLGEV